MARVVSKAVRSRQRPLRRTAEIPYGSAVLHLTPDLTSEVVASARRSPGTHNARRRFVEQLVIQRLADEYQRTLGLHGVGLGGPRHDNGSRTSPGNRSTRLDDDGVGFDLAEFGRQMRRRPGWTRSTACGHG